MKKDYYKILQIDSAAEPEVVQAAYKRLALKYHPDTNGSPEATCRMQELNEAYEVISDSLKRAEFDKSRQQVDDQRSRTWQYQQDMTESRQRAEVERIKREQEEIRRRADAEHQQRAQAEARRWSEAERNRTEQEEQLCRESERHKNRTRIVIGIIFVLAVFIFAFQYTSSNNQIASNRDATAEPVAVAEEFMKAIANKQIDKLTNLTCSTGASNFIDSFDYSSILAAGLGVDEKLMRDAISLRLSSMTYEETSRITNSAIVKINGHIDIVADRKLVTVVKSYAESHGEQAVSQSELESAADKAIDMLSSMAQDINNISVDLVLENGKWLVCK